MFGKQRLMKAVKVLAAAHFALNDEFQQIKAERDELKRRDEFFRAALEQTQAQVRKMGNLWQELTDWTERVDATMKEHGKAVAVILKPKKPRAPRKEYPDDKRCTANTRAGARCTNKAVMHGTCNSHTPEPMLFDNGLQG